jgi:hypothetical protein
MEHITYDDNVARLVATHPSLFTCSTPAYSDLPSGWYPIVDTLCNEIKRELGFELSKQFSVEQIKEKFGTLRFYWSLCNRGDMHLDVFSPDGAVRSSVVTIEPSLAADAAAVNGACDRLRELVDEACEASARVCQRCGAPGSLRPLGWVQTLCDQHFAEAKARPVRDDTDANE